METKKVIARLIKEAGKIRLKFEFNKSKFIDIEDNNSEHIKEVFCSLLELLVIEKINVTFSIDDSVNANDDKLFIDASKEYIVQLNKEINALNDNDVLKLFRG